MKPQPSDVSISGVVRLPGHLTAPFREFNSRELPLSALAVLSLLTTLYAFPTVGSLAYTFDEDKKTSQIVLVKVTGALNIPVIILCWLTLYFRYCEKHCPKTMTATKRYIGSMVQNLYSNLLTLSLAVQLCARMAYGECKGNSISEQAFCNPNHSTKGLPEGSLLSVVWTPIMFAIIMRDTDWNAIVLNWLIATVTIPYCVIQYQPMNMTNLGIAFVIPVCTASAIYSNQLQNVRSFVIQQQLAAVIKQNEEMTEELRANELRHMIGNVAHDLKTPLASFVSGLDMVADIAQDGLRKLSSIDNCCSEEMALYDGSHYKHLAKEVRGWLEGVLCSVQNSHNVNNFMMMTINRCIDYTKASKAGGNVNGRVSLKRVGEIGPGSVCQLPGGLMQSSCRDSDESAKASVASGIAPRVKGENRAHSASDMIRRNRRIPTVSALSASSNRSTSTVSRVDENSLPITSPRDLAEQPLIANISSSGELFLLVEIEDTGIGLTEEGMATLFNAFKQAQKLAGGTGLGLFSLARRVEALGGSYGVRKRLDGVQGSVFWFAIPYRPDAVFAEAATATLEHAITSRAPLNFFSVRVENDNSIHSKNEFANTVSRTSKGIHDSSSNEVEPWRRPERRFRSQESDPLTILIVDDAPSIQKMMSMMLRRHGHNVDQADNGVSGLSLVTRAYNEVEEGFPAYDVVLMDLQMPVMDGLEATRRIREAERLFCENMLAQRNTNHHSHVVSELSFTHRLLLLSSFSWSGSDDATAPGLERSLPVFNASKIHQFIIGISANSDTDTMNEAFAAGVDAFISKPFSIDVFYQTYNQHCDGLKYVVSGVP
eukprot:scaffold2548_cov163-Ochromonas_danica.AAC.8